MKSLYARSRLTIFLVTTSVAALGAPLYAQDADASTASTQDAGTAESPSDIIVSARRRDELLQDVPLSITVFDRETLADKNVDSPLDLAKYTPNFHFYSANGRQDTSALLMRGLNTITTDTRYQNVSFFVDGVPVNGTVMGLPTASIERIEIIKGPQSATFGKATYSGAINYVTPNPMPESIEGTVRVRYMEPDGPGTGSFFGGLTVRAPLVREKLWFEISGSHDRKGALFSDQATGAELGRLQTREVTGILYARPSDSLTFKLRASYARDDDSAPALVQQGPRVWARDGTLVTLPSGILWSTKLSDPEPVGGCNGQGLSKPVDCGTTRDKYFASLIATYDTSNDFQIVYRGGYNYQRNYANNDFTYASVKNPLYDDLPIPTKSVFNYADPGEKFTNNSHQIELLSPTDGSFDWRIGAGYLYDTVIYYQTYGFGALAGPNNPEGQQRGKMWSRNIAAFAGVNWNFVPALTLSLEGRVERQTVGSEACTVCFYFKDFDQKSSGTNFLPRATLRYEVTPDNSFYVLFARGTRLPRYNDTQSPTYPLARAEWLNNYEAGMKNVFADGRATLNLAVFYQKLSDQQYRTLIPGTATQSIQNVASSRVWGGEIEARAKLSPQFSVNAGLGYADHEFTSSVSLNGNGASTTNLFPPGQANVLGLTSYNTPKANGSVGIEWRSLERANGSYFVVAGDYIYTGSQWADLANIQKISAANEINLRLAYEDPRYTIALLATNLTNENTPTGSNLGGTRGCLFIVPEYAAATQACNVAGMRRPRQLGVEARVNF